VTLSGESEERGKGSSPRSAGLDAGKKKDDHVFTTCFLSPVGEGFLWGNVRSHLSATAASNKGAGGRATERVPFSKIWGNRRVPERGKKKWVEGKLLFIYCED